MPVSKRTRFEVLKRDKHTCRYCGASAPDAIITVDHVVPVSLGGTDGPDNLVAACRDCNYGKASTSPDEGLVEDVTADALRWTQAMKAAAIVLAVEDEARLAYCDAFLEEWASYRIPKLPTGWESSVSSLHHAGLPVEIMREMARLAQSAYGVESRFRYFMGCSWKRVAKLQEVAGQILAAEGAE